MNITDRCPLRIFRDGQYFIVACRNITLRERILRFLLGEKCKLTILVPGDTVREITIKDVGGVCRG